MQDAVIIDAVRTPGGKRNGQLRNWHPVNLASLVLSAISQRNALNPEFVDDVIMGCVMQVSDQALNIARSAVLAAGWPESVPATTIDRQCGSSQQAMHFAAQGVMSGAYDVVVAAGVESMTRVPMGTTRAGGNPWPENLLNQYSLAGPPNQGLGAEMIADEYNLSRQDLDEYSFESQKRATTATREGRFENEIVQVPTDDGSGLLSRDEGIRENTSLESLAALKPSFKEDGKVTAGNSSQISDGASAVLIMSAEKAKELGLTPRARFHSFALAGADPVTMLKGPIPATRTILEKSGLSINDIELFEINEAFASVVLAWQQETGADLAKVNPNGGAIALGHPLGSSGTKLMATLLNGLERTGGRYGLQVMCEGGGMANATIIERIGA
ncbi:MAG: thiolase family protein [Acidimicrobiales bacterium]